MRAHHHRVGKARHFGLLLGGKVKANDTPGAMNGRALPYTNFFSPSIRLRIVPIRSEAMSAFRSRNAAFVEWVVSVRGVRHGKACCSETSHN